MSTAVSADRQSAADHLAQADQVRLDAKIGLRPAERHPETGHHFIKNQQNSVMGGQFAHFRQIAVLRQNHAHIARHRFDDHRGNQLALLHEQFFHCRNIVERQS